MNNQIEKRRMRVCLWLVNMLQRYKRMTLNDIRQQWAKSEFGIDNPILPRQTFVEHRSATEDFLDVRIACDRRTNEYYLAEKSDSKLSDWLISSFNISSLVREQQDVRDRILLDTPPQGIEHFSKIVEAFRNGFAMQMTYRKFTDSVPYECFIEPYCLKHHQQRWYLLARKDHRPNLQTFALDRIVDLEPLIDKAFMPDEDFSPRAHFAHSFGVYVGLQQPAQIRIRAYGVGRDYLRTAPLHASQHEKIYSSEASDFILYCRPTRDLLLHLLSQGADIEVMEPASFRDEMQKEIRAMKERYE